MAFASNSASLVAEMVARVVLPFLLLALLVAHNHGKSVKVPDGHHTDKQGEVVPVIKRHICRHLSLQTIAQLHCRHRNRNRQKPAANRCREGEQTRGGRRRRRSSGGRRLRGGDQDETDGAGTIARQGTRVEDEW